MSYNPAVHHRRSIRLKGYDYAQAGAYYFITICTENRLCLFGEIVGAGDAFCRGDRPVAPTSPVQYELPEMRLNAFGEIVRDEWEKTARIRAEIELGEYVIMPNHFHAIFFIIGVGDRPMAISSTGDRPVAPTFDDPPVAPTGPKPKSVGALMAGFKSAVTKRINEQRGTPGVPVWQRNYWEHIIRNEESYLNIAEYIVNNPAKWEIDKLYVRGRL